MAVGIRRCLGPVGDTELGDDPRDVDACGLWRHEEPVSDLMVGSTLREKQEHLALSCGQSMCGVVVGLDALEAQPMPSRCRADPIGQRERPGAFGCRKRA